MIIEDSEIELFNQAGFRIVDMTNKETITIKCQNYTLIYSTDRIICFGRYEGEVRITRKSSSLSKLCFSFLQFKYDKK